MKISKRLVSLTLAMLMALSVMVVPASAIEKEDEIEPLVIVRPCPDCIEGDTYVDTMELPSGISAEILCEVCHKSHRYDGVNVYSRLICMDCGYEGSWEGPVLTFDIYCKGYEV